MKKTASIFLLSLGVLSYSQFNTGMNTEKTRDSGFTFGGSAGVGGSFGSNGGGTTVYVTPKVGYKITNDLEAGLAGNLSWQSSKYYSSTIVGVGPFANYYINRNFYLSSLFQEYFINSKDKFYNEKFSTEESALYLGGGYMQRINNSVYMQIGVMYNVLYKENTSIFTSGFVPSVGVVFGL